MALTKTKLKQSFREQLTTENKKSKKKDDRILNYFDMEVGEKMKILLVPDVNGNLLKEWEVHGPKMKLRGAGQIRCCYESSGENCPACGISFDYYEKGDKTNNQRWIKQKKTLAQCVVIDSPIEIPDNPDDTLVKLLHLPNNVKKIINEALLEEIIDDPTEHVLVLKKTENEGGWSSYEFSYFLQTPYEPDETMQEAVDSGLVEAYDFDKLEAEGDIVPRRTSTEDVQEWVDRVRKLEGNMTSGGGTDTAADADDNDDDLDKDVDIDKRSSTPSNSDDDDDDGGSTKEDVQSKLNRFKKNRNKS